MAYRVLFVCKKKKCTLTTFTQTSLLGYTKLDTLRSDFCDSMNHIMFITYLLLMFVWLLNRFCNCETDWKSKFFFSCSSLPVEGSNCFPTWLILCSKYYFHNTMHEFQKKGILKFGIPGKSRLYSECFCNTPSKIHIALALVSSVSPKVVVDTMLYNKIHNIKIQLKKFSF